MRLDVYVLRRVTDGKLVEVRPSADGLRILEQPGLWPPAAAPAGAANPSRPHRAIEQALQITPRIVHIATGVS